MCPQYLWIYTQHAYGRTTLKFRFLMGIFKFSDIHIEGEAYYAQHGGDLQGGKSLSHVLVIGLVWVRQLQTCLFSLAPYSGTLH